MSGPFASEADAAPADACLRPSDHDGTAQTAPSALPPEIEDRTMGCKVTVRCAWDEAAGVFFVHDSPVPGLATEAPTMPALLCKLPGMIRDLLGLEDGAYIDIYVERVKR